MAGPTITQKDGNREGAFIISEVEPIPPRHGNIGWYNPTKKELKVWFNGVWVDAFTNGINATVKVANKDLTFRNGVLVSYE